MCILSYTSYTGCGCSRKHATLPCPRAFYRELPQCDPMSYELANEVEGDCPDCKPAFDNKSGLESRVTLNFPSTSTSTSTSASSAPKPKDAPRGYHPMSSELRQLITDRRDRYLRRRRQGGRITPPLIPTPPTTIERTLVVPVMDRYTTTARHYILSTDQREALRRSGRHNIRRLSVISRSPRRSTDTSSSNENIRSTRRFNLSASQRAALARLGRGNVRSLAIVSPRRRQPPSGTSLS